ncbi:MAG: hypothetical protein CUN53_10085 [Phototrophicales bacterium]|nr:MAG: hypothetical protein CUN53_10085 [Phototrophicales bacterium]
MTAFQRHVLLVFMDGIGLGDDDSKSNPFAAGVYPTLAALAGGQRWLRSTERVNTARSLFIPTDPRMGVPGKPQSASGQATIITGRNIPALIGEHYGPRPNQPIRNLLAEENFFKRVVRAGKRAALIEGYPPRRHEEIASGKALRASYQEALHLAGLPMFGEREFYSGEALAVDWTGEALRTHLGYTDTPLYTPHEAGRKMVEIAQRYDFAMFSHWLTDVIGHRGTIDEGVKLLTLFDAVIAGALDAWDDEHGLMIITSDHGNMEDLSHGKHTENDVATVVVGRHRETYAADIHTLADIVPVMARFLNV